MKLFLQSRQQNSKQKILANRNMSMVLSFFGNGCHLPSQIKILNFILNACFDIFFVISYKAGTEGFCNAFGSFSQTNNEIKYKNIVQNFVEKTIK